MPEETSKYLLRTARDLLATVLYVLEFPPIDSIVAVIVDADSSTAGIARCDFIEPPELIATALAQATVPLQPCSVHIVGYGPTGTRTTVQDVTIALAEHATVLHSLFVNEDRYFCLSPDCGCTGADGTVCDPAATAVAAQATVEGAVIASSRDALLARVQPDPAGQVRVAAAMAVLPVSPRAGGQELRSVLRAAESGERLDDEHVARLAAALQDKDVRDVAMLMTTNAAWLRELWLDVTRRVPDSHVAAPATLAGWAAYLGGNGVLATAAVQRALTADATYTMAQLIHVALDERIPPRVFLHALS